MSKRSIAVFSSLIPSPPCFVIPVFSVPGTNDACVQNLDAFGKIESFHSFDTSNFHTVPILPPTAACEVGDEGLTAFWLAENDLLVGTISELKLSLSAIDNASLPSFTAVEIASLCESKGMLLKAAKRAAVYIKNDAARASYINTILNRPEVASLARLEKRREDDPEDSIQAALSELESEFDDQKWYDLWSNLFWKNYSNLDLHNIAQWRVTNRGLGHLEPSVVNTLISHAYWHHSNVKFANEWLHRRETVTSGWAQIWNSVAQYSYGMEEERLYTLGARYLDAVIDSPSALHSEYYWGKIWRRMWRRSPVYEQRLLEWAKQATSISTNNNQIAENVVLPILDKYPETYWALEFVSRWLREPIVNSSWVTAYIKYGANLMTGDYGPVGLKWLEDLGAGSNQWIKLWRHLEPQIGRAHWEALAIKWLLRARKNLKSWPQVFQELLDKGGPTTDEKLHLAASDWSKANPQISKSRIHDFANPDFRT